MGEINICSSWLDGFKKISDLDDEVIVELYVDKTPTNEVPKGYFRIIVLMEPFSDLKKQMLSYLRQNKKNYNYIFTYYDDILNEFDNSLLSMTPTSWLGVGYKVGIKDFGVSSLVGNKHNSYHSKELEGYSVRWELFNNSEMITIPKKFFISSHSPINGLDYDTNLILREIKDPLFDTQFHIVIENTNKINNMFTEKLIDCLISKTVPIYYGAPNIGKFFDDRGIFIVNNVSDIIKVCNNLNENTYNSMIEYIENNYLKALDYVSSDKLLITQTKELLNKLN